MRFQALLVVLAFLQVPNATFGQQGQKLTYLPSLGIGYLNAVPPTENTVGFWNIPDAGYSYFNLQLIVFKPFASRLAPGTGVIHRAALAPFTGYSFGIASQGRSYFVGLSAGPNILIPGFSSHSDGRDVETLTFGFNAQAVAFVMSRGSFGLGLSLCGTPAMHGYPMGWGLSVDLTVRKGWTKQRR